jgi:DNA-binding protein
MDPTVVKVGKSDDLNYVTAVSFNNREGRKSCLVARGKLTGKAVTIAMKLVQHKMVVARPAIAELGQVINPSGGFIATLSIPLDYASQHTLPAKPDGKPIIVGHREPQIYAMTARKRFTQGSQSQLIRAREEGPICIALAAANMAANLGFAEQSQVIRIGEEALDGGRLVPFVEIVLVRKSQQDVEANRPAGDRSAAA